MAGIIAVYSLVIAVLLVGDMGPPDDTSYSLHRSVQTHSIELIYLWDLFTDIAQVVSCT